jgi:hypothetical protein
MERALAVGRRHEAPGKDAAAVGGATVITITQRVTTEWRKETTGEYNLTPDV